MKSLLTLHLAVLTNYGEICSVETAKDEKTLIKRHEKEGDGFLTVTLPEYAKSLERVLDNQDLFSWETSIIRRDRGLPIFMKGFLEKIFSKDGTILDDVDPEAIRAIRQVCYLTHKIEREARPDRVKAAFDQYVETDRSLMYLPGGIPEEKLTHLLDVSRRLYSDLFQHLDNQVANWNLIPKHGPGAVADRLSSSRKWTFPYWTQRLEDTFPFWRYAFNTPVGYRTPPTVTLDQEIPVRVITVPKTQKSPRIIAIEPSAMQYAQQALKNEIYKFVDDDQTLRGMIGFTDQSRNQELARLGSLYGSYATLDLSEASDRLHWWLVDRFLQPYPHLRDYVWNCRSYRADVPGHGVIPLVKFASMGSALTFPIQSIVFLAIAVMGVEQRFGSRYSPDFFLDQVSVFGDDIIVPTQATADVKSLLETFGLKVNDHKSFWTGRFRESCGGDFWNGHDVTVVRLKKEIPTSRSDASALASFVAFRNIAYKRGLWGLARTCDQIISAHIRFVNTNDSGKGLNRHSFLESWEFDRYNDQLHRYEVRVPYLHTTADTVTVDGEHGLLRWFLEREISPIPVSDHEAQERSIAFNIYNGWSEI